MNLFFSQFLTRKTGLRSSQTRPVSITTKQSGQLPFVDEICHKVNKENPQSPTQNVKNRISTPKYLQLIEK